LNDQNQTVKVAEILPVLDGLIGFMQEALGAHDALAVKNAQLETQLASREKIYLEKVASASTIAPAVKFAFNQDKVTAMLSRLQEMNIIDSQLATKYANDIQANPEVLLPLVTQISEALLAAPDAEGTGIVKEAASDTDDDPDGWKAFGEGRPVRQKH